MRTLMLGVLGTFIIFNVHCLETTEVTSCKNSDCNQHCIKDARNGGYCQDEDCWCWNTGESGKHVKQLLTKLTTPANATSCVDSRCNQKCIASHWNGGYCKDGQCWCWRYGESARREDKPLAELKSFVLEVGQCDTSRCQTDCGGYCQDDKCWCRIQSTMAGKSSWTLLNDLPTNFRDTEGNDVTSCTVKPCLGACKKEGATDGFCLKDLCWCSLINETTIYTRNVRPVIELQANVSDVVTNENICHPSDCRRQCNNDNKTAGAACFYGYCWCDDDPKKIQEKQVRKQMSNILK